MKRFFASLLLVGALLGLFGGQMAAARSVPMAMSAPKAMAMDSDCMAMMAKQQPAPEKKPCKGLTLDCIAAMGCVVPLAAADLAGDIATPRIHGALGFWPTNAVLAGKSFGPDPDPPTNLG
ncbi:MULTISPECIES: hypothetical protein [Sphingomonadales]|uniref:Uncharacterized protein n=5 Tax=Sphingomonadaceae TaxID=41297 RepID=A0A2A4FRK0_9SPHN|nr:MULTISPECIES: hypothetical protein [Sphingomonadaceae]AJR26801.1 hypothetical protein TZ53_23175 [Sphingobium sp. YBL2]QDC40281.1 hypothetical protein FIL70_24385 [Sphingobium fuliginis ATCC 27551]AMK20217.1 hypothetical protein K663_19293 [Sphingobium sp. MI1205]API61545.1 hypothetical protein BSL82_19120 [Tardibacter chloracetimidivorans]ATE67704.1 hypothetical protein CMV14_23690 [Rhizorhabdus dicambivorans]